MSLFRSLLIGLAPGQLEGAAGTPPLPAVALVFDGTDWTFLDGGVTEPDGWAVDGGGGDIAVDDTVSEGYDIGFDVDNDPYVDIP